ncbi:MAG: pyridoxamine 5'-phosphate oxidase [Propionibacteriales bacterium]|nr:pyridoxamine 5'-phosphate oxidase [Propionibacteriales bacterium]
MEPVRRDLSDLRAEYELGGLDEGDLPGDPLALFATWFDEARGAGIYDPNATVLGTVGQAGPSSRTVLLKGVDPEGFVFFTNYQSHKGIELEQTPECSLLFGWYPLQRQVRVEGRAERTTREVTEAYFATRPRGSQLGAWASAQSRPVAGRDALDTAYAEAEARFDGAVIPAPPHWGGYLVRPRLIEFWQGRGSRMHDRLVYRRSDDVWAVQRLMP